MATVTAGEHRTEAERALAALFDRRSTMHVTDVAPTPEQLDAILRVAVTVPDHGRVRPWRLVVIQGESRAAFGDALAAAGARSPDGLDAGAIERLRAKAFVAPTMVAVVARVDEASPIPAWEQVASAACMGFAMVLAAHQLGLAAIWKSTIYRDGPELPRVLDMGPADEFLGWVNLGQPARVDEPPRPPVDLDTVVRVLSADGTPGRYAGP